MKKQLHILKDIYATNLNKNAYIYIYMLYITYV